MSIPQSLPPAQMAQPPFPFTPPFVYPAIPLPMVPDVEKVTLFVGNLHPDVENNYLFQLFTPYGRVQSCRVMRDMYTGESREFGFVTFARPEEAQKAFEETNGMEVFTRELRVMLKRRIKDLNESANVMVKNIDRKLKARQLLDVCRSAGSVLSLVILGDKVEKPDSVGCGYVQFETEAEAQKFIGEFNGKTLCDKELQVESYIPSRMRTKPETKNVYIKNFPAGWEEERVKAFIESEVAALGPTNSVGVYPKQNSFYAFVAYEKVEDATRAIETFNGWRESPEQTGEPLFVGLAMSKRARAKLVAQEKLTKKNETNLYIRSVRPEVRTEELRAALEKYGKFTSLMLKTWENPHPGELPSDKKLQFGFINYERAEDAIKAHAAYKTDAALRALIDPAETRDFLFFAQPKRVRDQYLRVQRNNYAMMMAVKAHRMMATMGGAMRGPPPRRGKPRPPASYAMPPVTLLPPTASLFPASLPASSRTPTPQKTEPEVLTPAQKLEQAPDVATFVALVRGNSEAFRALNLEKQKKLIGHWMYNRVEKFSDRRELLPKITGMLIDPEVLDFDEKLDILENDELLKERIEEAVDILQGPKAANP